MAPDPSERAAQPSAADLAAHADWLIGELERIEAERCPVEPQPATMGSAIRAFKRAIGPGLVVGFVAGLAVNYGAAGSNATRISFAGAIAVIVGSVIAMAWGTRARLHEERVAEATDREIRTFARDRERRLTQATAALEHTRAELARAQRDG